MFGFTFVAIGAVLALYVNVTEGTQNVLSAVSILFSVAGMALIALWFRRQI